MVDAQQTARSTFHPILLVLSVITFTTALHLVYQHAISPENFSRGLTYRTPDMLRYFLAIFLVILVAWCLPRECRRPSDVMQWFPFVLAGAPSILLPQYMQSLTESEASWLALSVAGAFLLCRALTYGSVSFARFRPPPIRRIWTILVILTVIFYMFVSAEIGLQFKWVALDDVYGTRTSFGASVGGTIVPRFLPWFSNVVNPVLIVRGLFARQPFLLVVGILGQVQIYLWGAEKSVLFSIPTIILLFFLVRKRKRIFGYPFLAGVAGVIALAVALDSWRGSLHLTELVVRRTFIIPGVMTDAYVSVFQDLPRTHFAELWLGSANPSVISRQPAYAVGRLFFNDPSTHANVNLWGHGYSSFGYLGMLIIAVLYAFVLRALDACSEDLPPAVIMTMFAPMAIVVCNANLFTTIITHGLFAMMLVCLFLPRTGWDSVSNRVVSDRSPTAITL